ncbi:unnamed protein product [Amoebophrya sp. A120]|nr:unnamed protein product [Amoebophrya sp. A120]|eukprot:GSA120T00018462001.1
MGNCASSSPRSDKKRWDRSPKTYSTTPIHIHPSCRNNSGFRFGDSSKTRPKSTRPPRVLHGKNDESSSPSTLASTATPPESPWNSEGERELGPEQKAKNLNRSGLDLQQQPRNPKVSLDSNPRPVSPFLGKETRSELQQKAAFNQLNPNTRAKNGVVPQAAQPQQKCAQCRTKTTPATRLCCHKCGKWYCLKHRHPEDHACSA